jgi:transposase-like protein
MSEKRKYNPELKAEAIRMVNEQGQTHADVSRQLGIPKGTIGNWVAGYGMCQGTVRQSVLYN